MKRLCDVVVRSHIEAVDFFHHRVPGGHEDDRNDALLAQTAEHFDSVQFGQAYVEFNNVILLDRRDLHLLIRILGTEELAQAFISVGKRALGELCRRLPKEHAEELIEVVKTVDRTDLMDIKTAQRFLARVLLNFKDTEELFQKAGLFRLSKAALLENQAFHKAFSQRIPKDIGALYMDYVEKAADIAEWDENTLKRLQDRILIKIRDLSAAETISSRYASLKYFFHNAPPPQEQEAPST